MLLAVQRINTDQQAPSDEQFQSWAEAALQGDNSSCELTMRLVDEAESRQLNLQYRDKDSATNVLSFLPGLPREIEAELKSQSGYLPLGDLVFCVQVVNLEAEEQGKTIQDHWAHLVVHGVLHLLGHDHAEPDQAMAMEALEKHVLTGLGIADPYL